MNTRLKIICVLFGLVYLFIIGEHTVTALYPGFMTGFTTEGQEEVVSFYAQPVEGDYSYPTPLVDTKTGQIVNAKFNHFDVHVKNPEQRPPWLHIAYIIRLITSFFAFALVVYVPIQVYKVIRSIVKNDLFERKNISRIRKVGYCLIIFFIYDILQMLCITAEAQLWVHLEDYKIVFSMQEDYVYLLFGLIVLLFAEILKISHQMKEDVDLTI